MQETNQKLRSKLLIITGPQGSGNHLFAKIFSMHPDVQGWSMAPNEWQGHHEEPFNQYWQDPVSLKDFVWQKDYYVTSISCPYYKDRRPQVPKYQEFITEAKKHADLVIAIIGRDRNILHNQELRVRGQRTYDQALEQFSKLYAMCEDIHFISYELFYLYGSHYVTHLGKRLGFPLINKGSMLDDYLRVDANAKYITQVQHGDFDEPAKKASLIDS